jgi:uncharacterized SAM-binding protein YcdF (DUF218 family)
MFSLLRPVLSLFIVLTMLWAVGLWQFVNHLARDTGDTDTPVDAIVILTGGSERIGYAIELLNRDLALELFISGVGKNATIESILRENGTGLPEDISRLIPRITLGYEAENTKGNAIETAQWLESKGYKTVRLVTANYHFPRSMQEFHTVLPHIKIIPSPVIPSNVVLDEWWRYEGTRKLLIIEYHKFIASYVRSLL